MIARLHADTRRHADLIDRAMCLLLLACGAAGMAWVANAMVTLRLPCLLFL
ncbi:hypothetical protein BH11PSE7_BH11PSE7_21320 [soil metagenome]